MFLIILKNIGCFFSNLSFFEVQKGVIVRRQITDRHRKKSKFIKKCIVKKVWN